VSSGAIAPASDLMVVRLAEVRERIERGGGGGDVKVIAVTKGFGPQAVSAAVDAGLTDVGENYANDLIAKHQAVASSTNQHSGLGPSDLRWHFLGRLQVNKIAKLAGLVDLWQSVDRLAAATVLARRAPAAHVLIQVNDSGIPTRPGCALGEVAALADTCGELGLVVDGLMAVGIPDSPSEIAAMYDRVGRLTRSLGLPVCSMGMTSDLELAVAAGSTMVRVGRGLFGSRPGRDEWRR